MNNTANINDCQEMDGLIKFILAASLAVMPFLFEKELSFGILCIYLLMVTLVSKIKFNTLLISAASYGIIVVIPYLFGFFMNELLYILTNNELFTTNQGTYAFFLRLFRLFIIWYVSILYFHTTSMKTVLLTMVTDISVLVGGLALRVLIIFAALPVWDGITIP